MSLTRFSGSVSQRVLIGALLVLATATLGFGQTQPTSSPTPARVARSIPGNPFVPSALKDVGCASVWLEDGPLVSQD